MIAITQLPFLVSIYYSFTNLKDKTQSLIPEPTKYVGIDNYRVIFDDPFFRQAMWTSVKMTVLAVVLVLVWQWTPFMMLIMLAGLQSQPSDIIEAAGVDGASPFGIFRQLTLPHLRRYLELGALLGSIYIVQAFDAVDQMTGGGPGSTNIPYFVYQESIGGGFRYGSASAYAIVVVVFSIIIATFSLRVLSGLLKDEERA